MLIPSVQSVCLSSRPASHVKAAQGHEASDPCFIVTALHRHVLIRTHVSFTGHLSFFCLTLFIVYAIPNNQQSHSLSFLHSFIYSLLFVLICFDFGAGSQTRASFILTMCSAMEPQPRPSYIHLTNTY
jgi:hypothetical protein